MSCRGAPFGSKLVSKAHYRKVIAIHFLDIILLYNTKVDKCDKTNLAPFIVLLVRWQEDVLRPRLNTCNCNGRVLQAVRETGSECNL